MNELIRTKEGLSREQVLKLIEEKKTRVGGGYLTDQGALFLVASDLGISLKLEEARSCLGDLEGNEGEVTVVTRILSLGPPKRFTRRSDSSTGIVSKLVVYDSSGIMSVSLWDLPLLSGLLASGAGPGSLVKLSHAYARANLEGSVSLNLSRGGGIEKLSDSDPLGREIPTLDEKARMGNNGTLVPVAFGRVKGEIRKSEFMRSTGSKGYFTSFLLTFKESDVRVVIWENPNPVFENLSEGETVTLLNVGAKESEFQGARSLELHGNDTTLILEKWEESSGWINRLAVEIGEAAKPQDSHQTPNQMLAIIARILSIGSSLEKEKTSAYLLLCDSGKRKISVTALDDAAKEVSSLRSDDVVVCKPDSLDQVKLRATCTKHGSISKVRAERKDIPLSSTLFEKIEKLTAPSIVSLDVMSLSETFSREVQTKEGLVRRTELTIGDPTGEIKIYAWRGLSKLLDKITAGLRIRFEAVEIQSHEGKTFAVLKNYSSVAVVN